MEVIPKDTRYVPLVQHRSCCSPTCFQIVMLRHNIPLIPVELLGYELGLTVPKEVAKFFWHPRVAEKGQAGFGTRVREKEFDPNKFFKKYKIPLKFKLNLIDNFKNINEFKEYLSKVEAEDKDVLVNFSVAIVYGYEVTHGHVCVLDRVYLKQSEVRLVDPGYNSPKWKVVSIKKLYHVMKAQGPEKTGGFWELEYVGGRK